MVKKSKKRVIKKKVAAPEFKITKAQVVKVLKVVDAGLVSGLGDPVPGEMCIEAAVAYAFGEDHNDHPKCVLTNIAETKISINDWDGWDGTVPYADGQSRWHNNNHEDHQKKVNKLRAKTLRRLAVAQLGSKGVISPEAWQNAVNDYLNGSDPEKAKVRAKLVRAISDLDAGKSVYCEVDYDFSGYSLLDKVENIKDIRKLCESLVQILVKLKSPGAKFLYLTE